MMETVIVSVSLTKITCGLCGGVYAIEERYRQKKEEDGGFWECPYCKCSWGYPKDGSRVAQLERQLVQTRHRAEIAETERAHADKALRRIKRRVAHGVCPCCRRTFTNLADHMKHQHPKYVKEAR